MTKKKSLLILAVFVVFIGLIHLIPVYSKTGVLDYGAGNLCIGYSEHEVRKYRLIPNGTKAFNDDKKYFKAIAWSPSTPGCVTPVKMRLYLW